MAGQVACDLQRQQTGRILVVQFVEVERRISEGVDALNDAFLGRVLNLPIREPNRNYAGGVVRDLRVQSSDIEKNGRLFVDDTGDRTLLRSERVCPSERNVNDLV